jgi:hypothetical protein
VQQSSVLRATVEKHLDSAGMPPRAQAHRSVYLEWVRFGLHATRVRQLNEALQVPNRLSPVGFRLLVSIACLLICLGVAFAFWRQPNPPPFLVLHRPFSRPLPLRDRMLQCFPTASSWSWVPGVEDVVFGRRKPVNVYADVIALQDSTVECLHSSLALGRPSFSDTNGLQVWFLGGRELRSVRDTLKRTPGADFLSHPRINTADGCECSMFVGESIVLNGSTNDVGLKAAFFPRVRKESTDLFAMVSFSELVTNLTGLPYGSNAASVVSIQTDLDFAARLLVPKGSGFLLLDGNSVGAARKRFGALIESP